MPVVLALIVLVVAGLLFSGFVVKKERVRRRPSLSVEVFLHAWDHATPLLEKKIPCARQTVGQELRIPASIIAPGDRLSCDEGEV